MKTRIILITLALASLCGCDFVITNDPPSEIVARAQTAGSGHLSPAVSVNSIVQWLAKNRGPATEIESLCVAARVTASATWGDTTEGHLCSASQQVAFFRMPEGGITSDHQSFGTGLN
jgi:hypothetical protein